VPIYDQRVLIVGVIGLFPMLVYCLLLIRFNSRHRASMIPGTWDCAGMLLATSGFLLAGGPLVLAGLDATWRRLVLKARVTDWRVFTGQGDAYALTTWALVFVIAMGGAAILINRRKHITVLYNVDTRHMTSALEYIFNQLSIVWTRHDQRYDLQLMSDNANAPSQPSPSSLIAQPYATAAVTLVSLPSSCNVSLIWNPAEGAIRRLVEGEISQILPNIRAAENPSLSWLVTAAASLFAILVCLMVFILVAAIRQKSSLI
jgi:hypothetical protein